MTGTCFGRGVLPAAAASLTLLSPPPAALWGSTLRTAWARARRAAGAAWACLRTCRATRTRSQQRRGCAPAPLGTLPHVPKRGMCLLLLLVCVQWAPGGYCAFEPGPDPPSRSRGGYTRDAFRRERGGWCVCLLRVVTCCCAVHAIYLRAREGPEGAAGRMFTWSFCNVCGQHATPLVPVSRGAMQVCVESARVLVCARLFVRQ